MPLMHTIMLTTIVTLCLPLMMSTTTSALTRAMKMAFMQSLVPMALFINYGLKSTTTTLHWTTTGFNTHISLLFDLYTTLFTPVALFVTWAILEFASWYMLADPGLVKFMKYLTLFLVAMLILTTANNMLQLFIGWEGVGIMSFLLINWWHSRINANTSAMQAIIYNRIGDIGLIVAMVLVATNYNTWEMQQLLAHNTTPTLILAGLILAATGKSAQFGLHPWLPAAMEGPTPVSALLHSSTMVVAGVFLLIRMHPLMHTSTMATSACLWLGALTTTFAALCAMTQNDIKKIIAFSTSSQLGLMMLTIGMNQPKLAFLHILTHAFFKAMLFMCSGTIIHAMNDEQDIRKMGGMKKTMPITTSCLTLGSLALAGMPFLAGFYTKDIIIETLNTSMLNAWALLITMIATALTASYSTRLILYAHTNNPRQQVIQTLNETTPYQLNPMLRLAGGSILAGLLITLSMPSPEPQTMTMTLSSKLAAIIATLFGLITALDLAHHTKHQAPANLKPNIMSPATPLLYNILIHRQTPMNNLNYAQNQALQLKDLLWYEAVLPMLMAAANSETAKKLSHLHTGSTKTHLATFVITALFAFTWTNIYGTR